MALGCSVFRFDFVDFCILWLISLMALIFLLLVMFCVQMGSMMLGWINEIFQNCWMICGLFLIMELDLFPYLCYRDWFVSLFMAILSAIHVMMSIFLVISDHMLLFILIYYQFMSLLMHVSLNVSCYCVG